MKISRPPSPSPKLTGAAVKAPAIAGNRGKSFATILEKARAVKNTANTETSKAASSRKVAHVSDVAADLKAGKISPQAAIDKVVDRILTQQLGQNAPAAVREKLATALRESLADDPLLAAKVRALGRD
jgi:hypothetical protein